MKRKVKLICVLMLGVMLMLTGFMPQQASAKPKVQLHLEDQSLHASAEVILLIDGDDEVKMHRRNGNLYYASKPNGLTGRSEVVFVIDDEEYAPVKVAGSRGTINYWISKVERDDDGDRDRDDEEDFEPLTPILEIVYKNQDNTYTAVWGYHNYNNKKVDADVSKFTGNLVGVNEEPIDDNFEPGRVRNAIETKFTGKTLVWTLRGPDGRTRTATANSVDAEEIQAVTPILEGVYNNGDGTYTAVWGYYNYNKMEVDGLVSVYTGNLVNSTDKPMKENFKPGRIEHAFETKFTGETLVWTLIGPDQTTRSATANASNAQELQAVAPVLEDVYHNGDGTYTAVWGYYNYNNKEVDALVSIFTGNLVDESDVPIKENFKPGRVNNAFETKFEGGTLVWTLKGPDGTTRTATADATNAQQFEDIYPLVTKVYRNTNGTYTAVWGYNNQNETAVDARTSSFTGNLVNEDNVPMKNSFKPGTHSNVYMTEFEGSALTWTIKGPNGEVKSITAKATNAVNYNVLKPVLKKVYNNGNGTYTAVFGYHNYNSTNVNALTSNFYGNLVYKNQEPMTENFKPGAIDHAFYVIFKGETFTWRLQGPNGSAYSVTADKDDAVEYKSITPIVEDVDANNDGTFTVQWSYHNANSETVDPLYSMFIGNSLNNALPKQTNFNVGRESNAFTTTFEGEYLIWIVVGPDGNVKTATASASDAD